MQGSRKDGRVSKVKLAVGAASLFLFIIGVKRTFRMEEVQEPSRPEDPGTAGGSRTASARTRESSPERTRRAGD